MNRLHPNIAPTSPYPLNISISKAKGSYFYDIDGKGYLDFISGIGVSNLGHGHPSIVQAIKDQADKHLHVMVYGEMEQAPQSKFAQLLCQQLPEKLNSVFFVNSGTEANEAAIKLVKRVTGRSQILSCRGAYHGCSTGSLAISGNENKKYAFRPLMPGVSFVRFNVLEDLELITEQTAAIFIETIQGDAGIRIPSSAYMQALRKKCDETGCLLVMDEIQCGMGRTGKLFAFEHFGITPDVLTLGKALGGGMPIGAVIANKSLLDQFAENPMLGHISTFAGHPLVCAAGHAHLAALLNEKHIEEVEKKGEILYRGLQHPKVRDIRWKGLFFGVELGSPEAVQKVVEYCLDKGLLVYWFLSNPNSFRLAPPLNISDVDLQKAIRILREALEV